MSLFLRAGATTLAPLTQIQWAPTLTAHDPNPPFPLESSAPDLVDFTHFPTGGVVVGGAATPAVSYARAVAGGLVTSGQAIQAVSWSPAPTGELGFVGAVIPATSWSVTPSGGVSVSGSAAPAASFMLAPIGGLVSGGAAATWFDARPGAAGGVTIAGTADDLSAAFAPPSSWHVEVGGTADLTAGAAFVPAGGVSVGGSTATVAAFVPASAGGVVVGGAADASVGWTWTPSGAVVVGGAATVRAGEFVPTGGVVFAPSSEVAWTLNRGQSAVLAPSGNADRAVVYGPVPRVVVQAAVVEFMTAAVSAALVVVATVVAEGDMHVGQQIKVKVTFRRDGVPFDPAQVRCTSVVPQADGGRLRAVYNYGESSECIREGVGLYAIIVSWPVPGRVSCMWESLVSEEDAVGKIEFTLRARPRVS